jgi:hypothetical protein
MKMTRYLFLLLLTSVWLLHCKSSGHSYSGGSGVDTTFTPNTALTPYPGEIIWKARWTEGKRNIVFLVSHQLDAADGNGYDALFARKFVQNGKSWTPQWVYRDTVYGMGCDLGIEWVPECTGIQDLDGDGKMEAVFTYLHANRCDAGMVDTRLVVNQANRGGRIVGFSHIYLEPPQHIFNQFLRENGQDTVQYKQLEPELIKMGTGISGAASQKWDALLKAQAEESQR